jgi:hypothetical protein
MVLPTCTGVTSPWAVRDWENPELEKPISPNASKMAGMHFIFFITAKIITRITKKKGPG